MAWAVILLRFVQYGAAAILFGSSSFLLYSPLLADPLPEGPRRWPRLILTTAAALLVLAAPLGFFLQTVSLAGSVLAALDGQALHAALLEMNFGKSSIIRLALALACLIPGLLPPSRMGWWICAVLGAGICASFAWMGHGAASEGGPGWLHLIADIVHVLAAAGWIGALVIFCFVLSSRCRVEGLRVHAALAAFSGTGTLLVAAIILSGLVNNGFLVGWDIGKALGTGYGQVLAAKLVLFLLMLGLAAMNRTRHTPALAAALQSQDRPDLTELRRSIAVETAAAFGVLVLVSWLGTLQPVLQ